VIGTTSSMQSLTLTRTSNILEMRRRNLTPRKIPLPCLPPHQKTQTAPTSASSNSPMKRGKNILMVAYASSATRKDTAPRSVKVKERYTKTSRRPWWPMLNQSPRKRRILLKAIECLCLNHPYASSNKCRYGLRMQHERFLTFCILPYKSNPTTCSHTRGRLHCSPLLHHSQSIH